MTLLLLTSRVTTTKSCQGTLATTLHLSSLHHLPSQHETKPSITHLLLLSRPPLGSSGCCRRGPNVILFECRAPPQDPAQRG